MSSRTSSSVASPWWVPLDPSAGAEAPRARPPGVPAPQVGERSPAPSRPVPRFDGAARRRPDTRAALLLAALWVGLWAVFTVGVVLPAAAVHAPRERVASAASVAGLEPPDSEVGRAEPRHGPDVAGTAR